jgi:hypothetical protein
MARPTIGKKMSATAAAKRLVVASALGPYIGGTPLGEASNQSSV